MADAPPRRGRPRGGAGRAERRQRAAARAARRARGDRARGVGAAKDTAWIDGRDELYTAVADKWMAQIIEKNKKKDEEDAAVAAATKITLLD